MNYMQHLETLRKRASDLAELQQEMDSVQKSILYESNLANPDYSILVAERERELALRQQTLENEIVAMNDKIIALQTKAKMIRSKKPNVDSDKYVSAVQQELSQIALLDSQFEDISYAFDTLFGSSKARLLLEQHIEEVTDITSEAALDELLSLSKHIEVISASLGRLNADIHKDTYAKVMSWVFPNWGTIFPRMTPYNLLILYAIYYLGFLTLLLYFPLQVTLPLSLLITLVMFVSMSKYKNIINSFKRAFKIKAIAMNAEEILTQNIEKKVAAEYAELIALQNSEADAVNAEAVKIKMDMDAREKEVLEALNNIGYELDEKMRMKRESMLIVAKNHSENEKEYRDMLSNLSIRISIVKQERQDILDVISSMAGIAEKLDVREELMDTNILMGFNDSGTEPILLSVQEPTYLKGDVSDRVSAAKLIMTQLMARMTPSKLDVFIYDPKELGMQFVHFISDKYRDYGVQLLTNKKEFDAWFVELEADIRNFRFTLAEFGDIHRYNKYMFDNNSVTRKYILVLLLDIPERVSFGSYNHNLGIHWVSLVEPAKPEHLSQFKSTFVNEFSATF